jgi:hypothetical protein
MWSGAWYALLWYGKRAVKSIERGIGKGACERPLEPAKGEEGS